MRTLLPAVLAIAALTGCAEIADRVHGHVTYPNQTPPPEVAAQIRAIEAEQRAARYSAQADASLESAKREQAIKDLDAAEKRDAEERYAQHLVDEAACQKTPQCVADRRAQSQAQDALPVCQARADLAETRATVAAIQTKRARFGVVDLHALSEAADEVIRLEGELSSARATYRAQWSAEAVCP